MKRLALNASPRGRESNSRLLIDWIIAGFETGSSGREPREAFAVLDLARTKDAVTQVEAFLESEEALIVMPLYTDQAPGVFMNFADALALALEEDPNTVGARLRGKRVGFVVQSGFPESIHSEALRDWLLHFSRRLGFHCLGVAIKGGVEGIRMQSERMQRRLKASFMELGSSMASGMDFPDSVLKRLAAFRRLGFIGGIVVRLLGITGMINFYWNLMLKKHGAWERRFDAPYA